MVQLWNHTIIFLAPLLHLPSHSSIRLTVCGFYYVYKPFYLCTFYAAWSTTAPIIYFWLPCWQTLVSSSRWQLSFIISTLCLEAIGFSPSQILWWVIQHLLGCNVLYFLLRRNTSRAAWVILSPYRLLVSHVAFTVYISFPYFFGFAIDLNAGLFSIMPSSRRLSAVLTSILSYAHAKLSLHAGAHWSSFMHAHANSSDSSSFHAIADLSLFLHSLAGSSSSLDTQVSAAPSLITQMSSSSSLRVCRPPLTLSPVRRPPWTPLHWPPLTLLLDVLILGIKPI